MILISYYLITSKTTVYNSIKITLHSKCASHLPNVSFINKEILTIQQTHSIVSTYAPS